MADISNDDLARIRLLWPEPLLIDLVCESYDGPPADRLTPARLHVRFLRELFDGKIRAAAASRVELIGCCAAHGISPSRIDAADQAVLLEMIEIIRARFRNSPRLCLEVMKQLHAAVGHLPKRQPERSPVFRPGKPARTSLLNPKSRALSAFAAT